MMAVAIAAVVGGTMVAPIAAQAAKPSITIWVDAPRLPGAKLYAQIMKGKVDVKVELHGQSDLVNKVQLFNRVKKGWPDVVFGPPNDVAVLRNPLINDAMALDSLAPASFWKGFGNGNNWCKADGKIWCVKNDLAQTVLWYDTKLFKDFGYTVPKTMDQFVAIGMDLAKNHPGYSLGALGSQGAYSSYLWPSQCPLNHEKSATRVVINGASAKCTRVATMIQPLIDNGVLSKTAPWDAGYIKDVGQAGKVVATIGPSWFGEFVIRPASSWAVPAGRIATAPMPMWPGETVNYSGEWGGGIYTVSPHSKFPKEALAFAQFMVSDKRNIVSVLNPDGSHGAPTFPAYGPGNALWHAKISGDPYYASDPFPAMLEQSQKIFSGEKPVRYDTNSAMEGTFANALSSSGKLSDAITAFTGYISSLAQQLGYEVTKS